MMTLISILKGILAIFALVLFLVVAYSLAGLVIGAMLIAALVAWALGVPVKVTSTEVVNGRRIKVTRRYRRFTRID